MADFLDKNLLALYPAEDSGFPARFFPMRPYVKSLSLLNYADACHSAGIKAAERHIRELVAAQKIDIVLVCPFASDYQLSVDFYTSLRRLAKVVFWFADDPLYFNSYNRWYAHGADAVITTDPSALPEYAALGIPAVLCNDLTATNKYAPVGAEKDTDVCFIGDARKRGRREFLDFLRAGGIKVTVYGQGSENGFLPPDKVSETLCRSRINLNFSGVGEADWKTGGEPPLGGGRQNTGRPREIALTGAFCLTEFSPGLEMVFPAGLMDSFKTREELLEKVKFYLANADKRETLAAAAHKYALANFPEEVYLPRLFTEVAAALAAPRSPASAAPPSGFKAREVNSLTFSFFVMLKRGALLPALGVLPLLFRRGPAAFLAGFPAGLLRALARLPGKLAGGRA
ncbi:MAG: glycosyltransferase [Elusimicrobiales bacterium]|nr:glycosyltransferase [Elusimicrobiales bacterium]